MIEYMKFWIAQGLVQLGWFLLSVCILVIVVGIVAIFYREPKR